MSWWAKGTQCTLNKAELKWLWYELNIQLPPRLSVQLYRIGLHKGTFHLSTKCSVVPFPHQQLFTYRSVILTPFSIRTDDWVNNLFFPKCVDQLERGSDPCYWNCSSSPAEHVWSKEKFTNVTSSFHLKPLILWTKSTLTQIKMNITV